MIYQIIQSIDLINDYFNPLEISFNWGIFLGLLGVYLGVLSLIKGKARKSFVMEPHDSYFYSGKKEILENVKITKINRGDKVDELMIASIYFGNDGNVELKKDDFASVCSIRFNKKIELKEYLIKSSDEFTLIDSSFDNGVLQFNIKFIDPKTFLKIEVHFKCIKIPEIKAHINLVRGNRKVFKLKDYDFDSYSMLLSRKGGYIMPIYLLGFGILLVFMFLISKIMGFTVWDKNGIFKISNGWVIVILLMALIPTRNIIKKIFSFSLFGKKNYYNTKKLFKINHFENQNFNQE